MRTDDRARRCRSVERGSRAAGLALEPEAEGGAQPGLVISFTPVTVCVNRTHNEKRRTISELVCWRRRPKHRTTGHVMANEEVETTTDEDEEYQPTPSYARRTPSSPRSSHAPPPPPTPGEWERVHEPDEPRLEPDQLQEPVGEWKTFWFYLQLATSDERGRRLHKITLPRSWITASVGRLVLTSSHVAALSPPGTRGPLDNVWTVCAALVRKETAEYEYRVSVVCYRMAT